MANDQEIDRINYQISMQQFKDIGTTGNAFDDALQLARETYGDEAVLFASDAIGDGFALLSDKAPLVGVPMILLKWNFSEGDYINTKTGEKTDFCSIRAVTKDGKKVVFNDGGSGIAEQLKMYSADNFGRQGGLYAQRGLRESTYDHPEFGKATTYYIDTSAVV